MRRHWETINNSSLMKHQAVTFEGDGVHPKRLHRNHQIEIRALNVKMPRADPPPSRSLATVTGSDARYSRHPGWFSGRRVFDPGMLEPETDRPATDLFEAAARLIAHGIRQLQDEPPIR